MTRAAARAAAAALSVHIDDRSVAPLGKALKYLASNGVEAIESVARQSYDVVLMDVQMPEMDGFETTRRIRADPALARVPVVAMTANAGEDDRQRCLEAGMDGFESKPINPARICTNLARWLATVRARAGA